MRIRDTLWAWLILAGLAVAPVAPVTAGEEFRTVEPAEVLKNPQQFWAQGFVFKDTIESAPAGKARKFGDRSATAFRTRKAGECWADDVLVPALQDLKPGSECLFTATVFQQHGWFSDKYFVIVQQVTAGGAQLGTLGSTIATLQAYDSNQVYAVTAHRFNELQSMIQAELVAYAAEKNLTLREIFAPGSEHRERVSQAIFSAIAKLEQETRQPASVFLSDLMAAALAQPHLEPPPPVAAPEKSTNDVEKIVVQKTDEVKPATSNQPPAVVATNAPAVDKPVPPRRRSFFARLFGIGSGKPAQPKAAQETNAPPAEVKTGEENTPVKP